MKLLLSLVFGFFLTSCGVKYTLSGSPSGSGSETGAGSTLPEVQLFTDSPLFIPSSIPVISRAYGGENPAQVPQSFVDAIPGAAPLRMVRVAADANLQAEIDRARPGDVLVLPAGAVYQGNFRLPQKAGSEWVGIVSSDLSRLPNGVRVSPSQSASMAKIISPNLQPAIVISPGAHHYFLAGLEITSTHSLIGQTQLDLVRLGYDERGLALQDDILLPSNILFDRCYVHGSPTGEIRTGMNLNGRYLALTNSYLEDFHRVGAKSYGVLIWNGGGPYRISGSYLSAAGENIMIGEFPSRVASGAPTDIEISRNYLFKPLSWENPISDLGQRWLVRSHIEIRNARRVFIVENKLENNRFTGSDGVGVSLWARNLSNQSSLVHDISLVRNLILNVNTAMEMRAETTIPGVEVVKRAFVRDNLFERIGRTFFMVPPGDVPISEVVISNNSGFHADDPNPVGQILTLDGRMAVLVFNKNIFTHGAYGIKGAGQETGQNSLANFVSAYFLASNIFVGSIRNESPLYYAAGNYHPGSLEAVGLTSSRVLSETSPYRFSNMGLTDPGANMRWILPLLGN